MLGGITGMQCLAVLRSKWRRLAAKTSLTKRLCRFISPTANIRCANANSRLCANAHKPGRSLLLPPCSAAAEREFAAQGGNIRLRECEPAFARTAVSSNFALFCARSYHCKFQPISRFCRLASRRRNGNLPHKAAIFASQSNGNFACGENTHALRLPSELADLRAGYANPLLRVPQYHQILRLFARAKRVRMLLQSKRGAIWHPFCFGAGTGNRTRISCLGSRGFTTRLCLRTLLLYIKTKHLSSALLKFLAKSVRQSPSIFAAGL